MMQSGRSPSACWGVRQPRLRELRGIGGRELDVDAEFVRARSSRLDRLFAHLDAGHPPRRPSVVVSRGRVHAGSRVGARTKVGVCTRAGHRAPQGEPADTAVEVPQGSGCDLVDPGRDLIVEAHGHLGVRLEEALRAQVQVDALEVHPRASLRGA